MSRRIDKLQPAVQVDLLLALAEMEENNVSHFVDSTLRTDLEQIAYFAQGREGLMAVNLKRKDAGFAPISEKENKYTITNCDGVKNKSAHQSGKAVDIVPLDSRGRAYWPSNGSKAWKDIADIMTKYNFEAGLYWKDFTDPPHYQWKGV